uniref:GH16 domain-containing protein n=2 Tax=Leptocylindrus danicus TaxID=163516 RepID=A0A7S2LHS3_9STRA
MSNTLADHETLLEDQQSRMQTLSSSQCVNTLCELVFNTSSLDLTGAVNATGTLVTQDDGTEIALWAFDSINLMTDVNVTLVGQRAMALLARSSIYIDAIFLAKPGTLGGFPGGYSVSRNSDHKLISVCDPDIKSSDGITSRRSCAGDVPLSQLTNASVVSNNVNGPGSGSARVYLKTIEIVAPIQNEIQVIMTNADAGQTIAGGFKLHYNGYSTAFLRHDITASALKYNIENSLNGANINILAKVNRTDFRPGIGEVSVSREVNGGSGGFTWAITFVSAVGNSDTISSTNLLSGTNANVIVETIQEGNSVGGMFQVGFLGFWTRNLSHAVSSSEMESAFLHDIPILETASVVRTDAANNCSDGFCTNGPTRAGGYIWTVTLTTQEGNISPGSPTSAKFEAEAPFAFMNATSKLLTGCIHLECPSMVVTDGHFRSNIAQMRNLVSAKPFSFAYGGAGAGYGGKGGEGFGLNPPGKEYGDDKISSLIGGSGGALGYVQPFEANLFSKPTGRGGSGGGAVEIVAMNDIVLGPNGRLLFDAEGGHGGMWTAGGGGSGGAVLLSAGGIVKVDGKISVTGGNGGIAIDPHGRSDIEDGHGGGGAGGRVAINAQSIVFGRHGRSAHVDIVGGDCKKIHSDEERTRSCDGRNGTLYLDESFSSDIFVDTLVGGAENTGGSLYIKSKQQVSNECEDGTHFGPSYDLGNATKPDRISFYARLDIDGDELRKYQHVSSNGGGLTFELLQENKESNLDYQRALLGLYVGAKMKHGSSYLGDGDCSRHLKSLQSFLDETQYKRWYKIDIRLNWSLHMYDILLDDVQAVRQAPFVGKSIKSINIGNSHPFITAWVDEIYIGNDFSMGFRCPVAGPHGIESSARPIQTGWKSSDIGGNSYNHPMQRHESHLSRRAVYSGPDHGNLVPFDGEGHRAFHSDIKFRHPTGDHEESLGDFNAGAITVISDRGAGKNYFMWYGEHENTHNSSNASSFDEILLGGVAACSSEDLITWKNEGLMLNYLNITDMVEGTSGPFRVERPKVLYNNMTSKYVMWMTVDNDERELGMAGVAISDFANGPFDFVRSFYPDGNETHDQTIFIDGDVDGEGRLNSTAYLVRTYYATIEYVLPAAVMQPMWESVKNIDGSTHFGLTYHRANYEPGYDNYHDIYLQRWRKEDIPWKVVCVDRSTGNEREVPYGKENLNHDGEICHGATEYKKVLGQGSPLTGPVKSRFLDPTDPANNVWVPNSVPGVKAQPWDANYKDGPCGVRELDDDIEILDADVDFADLSNEREKRSCASTKSNLVDNPIHPTPPDLLIGQETVVTSRRAKFVAINELTDDYLDTTGRTHVFEGELEDNADLGRLLWGLFEGGASGKINKFGWEVNDANLSGYSATPAISRMGDFGFETAEDWDTRFHQYEENYNDRAEYSLSCVIDGNCPANFRDQIAQA